MRAVGKGQIAILGDLHGFWEDEDLRYFNRTQYELLLFVGDLGGNLLRNGLRVAKSIARLGRPGLVMPGNNEVEHYPRLAAEFLYQRGLIELVGGEGALKRSSLHHAAGQVRVCGFSAHPLQLPECALTLIAGRPFALGGNELSYASAVQQSFSVQSLEESARRLCQLVDEAPTERLLFVAHNGPKGLGCDPAAPWGCDFKVGGGDWGDEDLRVAVAHARATGKRVLAVIAGHMHWSVQGGGLRRWRAYQDGTLYVNAGRVPRIFDSPAGQVRQHLALTLEANLALVEEVFVTEGSAA